MDFRDTLSADLPAPRDDEPGSLRDDILDELADHLACAYRREVMRGADPSAARQHVLTQFGDPAAVAHRLWLDAMRGRIMSQRVLVVCCILLTLISLFLAGMMSMQAVQAQRMAAEVRAQMAMEMHRAQEAQRKLLEESRSTQRGANPATSQEWNPVVFSLSEEKLPGPPAVGVRGSLGRGDQGSNKEGAIHRESDGAGQIDFGVVQPGDWEYTLSRATDDGGTWRATGTLNVLPGTAEEKQIICPSVSPQRVPITVRVDWPPDLADQGLAVLATLRHGGFTYQPPLHWHLKDNNNPPTGAGTLSLLGGPGPKRLEEIAGRRFYFWNFVGVRTPAVEATGIKNDTTYVDLPGLDLARDSATVQALPGSYRLSGLVALRPLKEHTPGFHGERGQFIAFTGPRFSEHQVQYFGATPSDQLNPLNGMNASNIGAVKPLLGSDSFWRDSASRFEARVGQPNEWTIRLPDELCRALRQQLNEEKKQ
jgi:hypothetical protein